MGSGDEKADEQSQELTGIDLVRRTLEEARAAARAQGKDAGRGRVAPRAPRRVAGQRRSWGGAGPAAPAAPARGEATRRVGSGSRRSRSAATGKGGAGGGEKAWLVSPSR